MNTNLTIDNLSDLLNLSKSPYAKQYLEFTMRRLVEVEDVLTMELEKVNRSKWQVTYVITENNSYNLTDELIYLTSTNYDITKLSKANFIEYPTELGNMVKVYSIK